MMRRCFAALTASLALRCAIAATPLAAPFLPLNDPGVFECSSPTWEWSTDCAGTGQDGEFGLDATRPNRKDGLAGFRFAKVCGSGVQAGPAAARWSIAASSQTWPIRPITRSLMRR